MCARARTLDYVEMYVFCLLECLKSQVSGLSRIAIWMRALLAGSGRCASAHTNVYRRRRLRVMYGHSLFVVGLCKICRNGIISEFILFIKYSLWQSAGMLAAAVQPVNRYANRMCDGVIKLLQFHECSLRTRTANSIIFAVFFFSSFLLLTEMENRNNETPNWLGILNRVKFDIDGVFVGNFRQSHYVDLPMLWALSGDVMRLVLSFKSSFDEFHCIHSTVWNTSWCRWPLNLVDRLGFSDSSFASLTPQ